MKKRKLVIVLFILLFTAVFSSFLLSGPFEQVSAENQSAVSSGDVEYYLIYYYPNGGAGGSETDFGYVISGAEYTLETWNYSRPGYNLIGWNTESDGSGMSYSLAYHFDTYDFEKNLKLYAVWQLKSYIIKYDSNGGQGVIGNVTVRYGEKLVIDSGLNFLRDGYHIDHWNAIYDDGTRASIYFSSQVIQNYSYQKGMTLYAIWKENLYTVTYKGNNAAGEDEIVDEVEYVHYGEKYVLKDRLIFSREGYTLSEWSTQSEGGIKFRPSEEILSYNYLNDLTLYANWIPNTYFVIFNYHDATGNDSDSGKRVTYDSVYGDLPLPTKRDCIFQGWYTLADEGVQITSETIVKIVKDQTIHAHWSMVSVDEYFLTVVAVPEKGGIVTQSRMCDPGTVINITATAAVGYEFVSWSDGGSQTHEITVNDDISLTAVFRKTINEYKLGISFSEGGQVIGSGTYIDGSVVNISAIPAPGYEFVSWSDGGSQTHTVVVNDDMMLTVVFKKVIAEERKSLTERIAESKSDIHLALSNAEIESDLYAVVDNEVLLPDMVNGRIIMLSVRDDLDRKLYSWTFDCSASGYNERSENGRLDIRIRGSFKAEDVFSEEYIKNMLSKVSVVGVPEKSLYMDFQASGPLPYRAVIDYFVGTEYVGERFGVYHYNETKGILEDTDQECIISATGYATFFLDHCSYYVLVSETVHADVKEGRPYVPILIMIITAITVVGAIMLYKKGSV